MAKFLTYKWQFSGNHTENIKLADKYPRWLLVVKKYFTHYGPIFIYFDLLVHI